MVGARHAHSCEFFYSIIGQPTKDRCLSQRIDLALYIHSRHRSRVRERLTWATSLTAGPADSPCPDPERDGWQLFRRRFMVGPLLLQAAPLLPWSRKVGGLPRRRDSGRPCVWRSSGDQTSLPPYVDRGNRCSRGYHPAGRPTIWADLHQRRHCRDWRRFESESVGSFLSAV
jgi:hypothetical protein